MSHFIIKNLIKLVVFLASRHRSLGIRDWIAGLLAIVLVGGAAVSGWVILFVKWFGLHTHGFVSMGLICLVIFVVSSVPFAYMVRLRRNGITDADYSVVTGIDYKTALKGAHAGFQFLGISASKLRDSEAELRAALDDAERNGSEIKMLLVDPASESVFNHLEEMDGTTGYLAKARGTVGLLQELARKNEKTCLIHFYRPNSIDEIKPLRLFFSNGDCLVSPFSPKNGVADQGRGLPQLRITDRGFPKAGDPTLYRPLKRYFDSHWSETGEEDGKRGGGDE